MLVCLCVEYRTLESGRRSDKREVRSWIWTAWSFLFGGPAAIKPRGGFRRKLTSGPHTIVPGTQPDWRLKIGHWWNGGMPDLRIPLPPPGHHRTGYGGTAHSSPPPLTWQHVRHSRLAPWRACVWPVCGVCAAGVISDRRRSLSAPAGRLSFWIWEAQRTWHAPARKQLFISPGLWYVRWWCPDCQPGRSTVVILRTGSL